MPSLPNKEAVNGDSVRPDAALQNGVKENGFHTASATDQETKRFWHNQADGLEATIFPALPSPSYVSNPTVKAESRVNLSALPPLRWSTTAIVRVRAAWAILLSRYTQSSDIIFGSVTEDIPGAIFVRVRVDRDSSVEGFVKQVEEQERTMRRYQHFPLAAIRQSGGNAEAACNFQNVLLAHHGDGALSKSESWGEDCANRALLLECSVVDDVLILRARFDDKVLPRADRILQQLGHTFRLVCIPENQGKQLHELELTSAGDLEDLWKWNTKIPSAVEACVHELIDQTIQKTPEATAICAWDGSLSYKELGALSTRLAYRLAEVGVRREVMVPLCFEKSLWTPVAMLAVLKAGGAFVLLDSSHPDDRLRLICQNVGAAVAVTSPPNASRLSSIVDTTLILDAAEAEQLPKVQTVETEPSHPTDAAYVIFTSGSTGEPKGAKIEHRSYASAALTHGPVLRINPSCRSLQFGSYSFAGAIMETLMPLIHGGCVCIPSEEQRRTGLAEAINSLNANWAFLTPTVLAYLVPNEVSPLKTICIGGEAIRTAQIALWAGRAHLRQTYGSAETSAVVSSAELGDRSRPTNVGVASTARYWIVDETDHNRLMPVGAAGEILIEGPVIAREYVGQPEKSAATFISTPSWRASFGRCDPGWRFYKTGDMGTLENGALELLGRKDTQIKLRGQRIELGEIEHQARAAAHSALKECVVELVSPHGSSGPGSGTAMLVAFLVLQNEISCAAVVESLRSKLETALPQYMVPTAFVPLQELPLTVTGKMNRRRLRQIGAEMSMEQLLAAGQKADGNGELSTPMQRQLREMIASVLDLDPDSIGADSNFLRLGGDSLEAMWLVAAARDQGLVLKITDVFRKPRLSDLALCLRPDASAE